MTFTVTLQWVKAHGYEDGEWSRRKLALLGVPWPLVSGWLVDLVGSKITQVQKSNFDGSKPFQHVVNAPFSSKRQAKKKERRRLRALRRSGKPAPVSNRNKGIARDRFYDSWEWKEVRYKALKLYGARCQCCGRTPADGAVMNVDHIKPRRRYPELELELSNTQVICGTCNQGKGSWDETDWRNGPVPEAVGIQAELDQEFRAIMRNSR